MKKLKLFLMQKQRPKAQSLMEMSIVLIILMMLALGTVEFGNLMNQYINLVDGTREGARYASNQDPYAIENETTGDVTYDYSHVQSDFYLNVDTVIDGGGEVGNLGAIAPLTLNATTDEVMIYFLSIRDGGIYVISDGGNIWCKFGCKTGVHPETEALIYSDTAFLQDSFSSDAPNTGIVIVELFYAYHQLLNLPLFTMMFPPDGTIQVHAYSIMPLSAAEPTPVVFEPITSLGMSASRSQHQKQLK